MLSFPLLDSFKSPEDAHLLARAIVDTLREPTVVLDEHLRVIVASRSFYLTFDTTPSVIQGYKIDDIDAGVWDIAELRAQLEKIAPEQGVMEGFEVARDFPRIGPRSMLLNARKVFYEGNGHSAILLGLEDVTERRRIEHALQKALEQRETLLAEMSHRVANSLQIIASILLMKARDVESEETRSHLKDAYKRILSVAYVQRHLQSTRSADEIEVGCYLSKLCETLAGSMIAERRPISVKVIAPDNLISSHDAVSIGLIVTELVINALKHAFPESDGTGQIIVGYELDDQNWRLSVSDDGVGMPETRPSKNRVGLGTTLIKALAQQLEAQVEIESSPKGTAVSITHMTFVSHLPTALLSGIDSPSRFCPGRL
jgi:chemotaxis protein methyltransferase CheR